MKYTTTSEQQTRELGSQLALTLVGGDIVLLAGDLGAGKTAFTKGVASGLGVQEDITSPTFSLMNMYNVAQKQEQDIHTLVHIDTYRIKKEQELVQIGAEDYVGQESVVTLIEWPERAPGLLEGRKTIKVSLDHQSENERTISILFPPGRAGIL